MHRKQNWTAGQLTFKRVIHKWTKLIEYYELHWYELRSHSNISLMLSMAANRTIIFENVSPIAMK